MSKTQYKRDIDRIRELPIYEWQEGLDVKITEELKRPEGTFKLHPHQAEALHALKEFGGLWGALPVGSGKTLIAALTPKYCGYKPDEAVVFTKAKLVKQAERDFKVYAEHFDFEPSPVISYGKLSHDSGVQLLSNLKPKLIVLDEAQELANPKSGRGRRYMAYMRENPDTQIADMSGTLTNTGIFDYAHLIDHSLADKSPLPRFKNYNSLANWAAVLDAESYGKIDPWVWGDFEKLIDWVIEHWGEEFFPPGLGIRDRARLAFARRLTTAPGVVKTAAASYDGEVKLIQTSKLFEMTPAVAEAISACVKDRVLPNGDLVDDDLRVTAAASQLAQGFYYVWDWPDGVVDIEWLNARSAYNRVINSHLGRRAGWDTPGRVDRMIRREPDRWLRDKEELYALHDWLDVEDRPAPPTKTIWFDESMIDRAVQIATETGWTGIFWYRHQAVAHKLRERGLDVFFATEYFDPAKCDPARPVCLSWAGHSTGLHLVKWRRNILLCPDANGARYEQGIGRTARQGQTAESVEFIVNTSHRHLARRLSKAKNKAKYIAQTQEIDQIILGTWVKEDLPPELEGVMKGKS